MGLPQGNKRELKEGWYWVKYHGAKQWAYRANWDYKPWSVIDCEVGVNDDRIEVLKGPYTEFDIDNASFDLQ